MAKSLELALEQVAALPETAQEQIGQDWLTYLEKLKRLRADIQEGIDELDAGLGRPLDMEDVIRQLRKKHGG